MGNCTPCGTSAPSRESHPEADAHKETLRLPLLRVAFEAIDKDKSGFVVYDELAAFGQYIGNRDWSEVEIKKMFAKMDKNSDGKVDLDEFQVNPPPSKEWRCLYGKALVIFFSRDLNGEMAVCRFCSEGRGVRAFVLAQNTRPPWQKDYTHLIPPPPPICR